MSKKSKLSILALVSITLAINGLLGYVLYNVHADYKIEKMDNAQIFNEGKKLIFSYFNDLNYKRFEKIYTYLSKDYRENISLEEFLKAKKQGDEIFSNYKILRLKLNPPQEESSSYTFMLTATCLNSITDTSISIEKTIRVIADDRKFYIEPASENGKEFMAYYYSMMALSKLNTKEIMDCDSYIKEGFKYNRNNTLLNYLNGQCSYLLGNFDTSIESMKEVLKTNNMDYKLNANVFLAASYANKKNFTTAKYYMDKATALDPKDLFSKKVKEVIDYNLNNPTKSTLVKKDNIDIILLDGSEYKGKYEDGLPNGLGTLKLANNIIKFGEFKNGILNGKGVISTINKGLYMGTFSKGVPSGEGIQLYKGVYHKTIYNYGSLINSYPIGKSINKDNSSSYYSKEWLSYLNQFNNLAKLRKKTIENGINRPPEIH